MYIKITVIDRSGKAHELEAPTDITMNLMEVCKSYELPVEGICGGIAMCASCQCYVLSNHPLEKKSPDEEAMLSEALHVKENSRLGCQIPMDKKLEGLKVELAP